jgi:hypothetical protein
MVSSSSSAGSGIVVARASVDLGKVFPKVIPAPPVLSASA